MTEEEKNQAAAYIKLQDDVKKLIVDIVSNALQSELRNNVISTVVYDGMFDSRVRDVIKNQMNKY